MNIQVQTTSKVLMIRPASFRYNEQTAVNNSFQVEQADQQANEKAINEFNQLVQTLKDNGVEVIVIDDNDEADTPDALFPNNWISTHQTGTMVIYPMYANNRRAEIREDIIDQLKHQQQYHEIIDWRAYTKAELFLEGTGSLVLDRANRVAYACISERTNQELVERWGELMAYKTISFSAADHQQQPIYHTNVMMALAPEFAVICLDSLTDEDQKKKVIATLNYCNKEIIDIDQEQMQQFAGNMIALQNKSGEQLILMSETAHQSLHDEQLQKLSTYGRIITSAIPTIETNGGGSVRCMVAELF